MIHDRFGLPLAAALALSASGCGSSEPPPDFELAHNQAPSTDGCEVDREGGGATIAEGTFDLVIGDRSSYLLTPLVRNRTEAPITVQTVRVRIFRKRAEDDDERIRIRCDGGELCEEWELDPCGGGPTTCPEVPAEGSASFEMPILPRIVTGYYQGLMDRAVREGRTPPEFELEARFELEGTTTGGAPIASETFVFPVRLCLGCLVEFPPSSDSPAIEGRDCCGAGTLIDACYPGQDDPVDCRRCSTLFPEICNFGRPSCG